MDPQSNLSEELGGVSGNSASVETGIPEEGSDGGHMASLESIAKSSSSEV